MAEFIPAEELKGKFDVFGHFYSVQVAPKKSVECRSVLEIVESAHAPKKAEALSNRKPDAVFIMMNPGSSRPLAEVNNRIHAKAIHELSVSLVPTKPDTTQYQVMRVMHYCEWQHVRVLNLSDLRCPQSGVFFKHFKGLEEDLSFDAHSIFSDRRRDELAAKLPKSRKIPLVFAWGLSEKLNPLIERCLSRLPRNQTTKGLLEEGTANKYRHPLPSLQKDKRVWLNNMIRHCEASP